MVSQKFSPLLVRATSDLSGVGGKRVFQELQAILPIPGKRLMCQDYGMKDRLEMEPSMSITCHAVAASSLDLSRLVLWHNVLALGDTYSITVDIIARRHVLLTTERQWLCLSEFDNLKKLSYQRVSLRQNSSYACVSAFSPCVSSSKVWLPSIYGLPTVLCSLTRRIHLCGLPPC